jgi:threonyl-tRNA synthetase
MQRVYAACFRTQAELDAHLHNLEEAKRRDHRKLGRELKLFQFTDEVGPGLRCGCRGARRCSTRWSASCARSRPSAATCPWSRRTSGARSSTRPAATGRTIASRVSAHGEDGHGAFVLKPMNCPHHIQIYKSELRSYRDLLLRLAEFGTVYRFEQSGELSGLSACAASRWTTRTSLSRRTTLRRVLRRGQLVKHVLAALGLSQVRARVGLRSKGGKWVGSRAVVPRPGRHPAGLPAPGPGALGRGGRSGLLRPQARLPDHGCPGPGLAARNGAGGLQPARAL